MISIQVVALLIFSFLSILGLGLGIVSIGTAVVSDTEMQERIQTYAGLPDLDIRRSGRNRRTLLNRLRMRINTMLSSLGSEELALKLNSANWSITVTEYMLLQFGLTFAGLVLGWLATGYLISGVGLAFMVYMVPGVLMRRSIHKRQVLFERQLIDVLTLISGSVRAGFSLLQAMEVVVKEMKSPASEEFKQVQREVALGMPLPMALKNLANRMQNDDLGMMVTAINIHYQVGGNLTTMLAAVTETIRDRTRLFAEVRVITTQQRYTSYLISLLPFFLGSMLFLMNPDYMLRMFVLGPLLCIPVGAISGIIVGHFVIRRITKIHV